MYDSDSDEVVCQGCGLVLNVGAEKPEAVRLLSLQPVIPMKLLTELCDLYAKRKQDHERVDATYAPEIQRLHSRITGLPMQGCKRCGTALIRHVGRPAEYCSSCKKLRQREFSKRYREKSMREDPQAWKEKRRRWRRSARERAGRITGETDGGSLGSMPLTRKTGRIEKILGIDTSLLKKGQIEEAWRIIGEQSEWVLNMLDIYREAVEVPLEQITQYLHYYFNMLQFAVKCPKCGNVIHL